MSEDQIIDPYTNIPLVEVTPAEAVTTQAGNANIPAVDEMTVGVGDEVFHANREGIWLGAKLFADALFSVTLAGVIRGIAGFIGGFEIGATYIRNVGNTFGLSSESTGADDIYFWAGTTYLDRANAEFWVTESGVVRAQSGTIGGWSLTATTFSSGGISLDSVAETITVGSGTPNLVIDGVNKRIRTSTYSTGLRGFSIEGSDGSAEFNNIRARGEFHSQVLSYGEVHVNAGSQIVSKSAAKLKTDFTSVTSPTTFNVDVDDPTTGHLQVFVVGDVLQIKDGSGNENWMTISSVSDQTTFFRYVCVKQSGTNATFRAGAAIADWGASGDGVIYQTADATNAPYFSIQTHTGSPWSSVTERVRIGNLNGFLDYVTDLFGIGIGDADAHMTYDPSTGLRIEGAASVNGSPLGFGDINGDGSDGAVTISSNTSLTRDMFYDTLTIDSGFALDTAGFRVHVKTLLTVNGQIGRPGNAGAAGGTGGNGSAGSGPNSSAGTAGASGAGGAALADGSLKGAVAGTAGTAGCTGHARVGNNREAGTSATASTAGTAVTKSLSGASGAVGGAGGAGGGCTALIGTTGGAAVSAGAAGTTSGTVYNKPNTAFGAWLLQDFFPSVDALKSSAGSSGGTGGASGGVDGSSAFSGMASGGGGGGGGAGSAGGIVAIYAKTIVVSATGVITAKGGDGGAGGVAGASATYTDFGNFTAAGGSGGGGGGAAGSGGCLVLVYSSLTNAGSITSAAGSAGAGGSGAVGSTSGGGSATTGSTGATGSSGSAGVTIQIII